jgi:hypothetical protein
MRSAEEWTVIRDKMQVDHLIGASDEEHMKEFAEFIQQIQLDAMKEGMRMARELVQQECDIFPTDASLKALVIEAIISASEQLTINDL